MESDEELLEIFRVGCELASLGTIKRIFVIPYLGYSTMERAVHAGEIVTAKANARMLSAIPNNGIGNFFLFCDLHVSGILQYFEGNCSCFELYAEQFLLKEISKIVEKYGNNCMFGSADLGRPLWVESFANKFKFPLALIRKIRNFEDTKIAGEPIGNVQGKYVIIYDDMTRSGGTLISAAELYIKSGAIKCCVVISHLALNNEEIITKLNDCKAIEYIICTNSHPMSQNDKVKNNSKFIVVDISDVFCDCIKNLK